MRHARAFANATRPHDGWLAAAAAALLSSCAHPLVVANDRSPRKVSGRLEPPLSIVLRGKIQKLLFKRFDCFAMADGFRSDPIFCSPPARSVRF
jgi:hypothetical protein